MYFRNIAVNQKHAEIYTGKVNLFLSKFAIMRVLGSHLSLQ